MTPTTPKTRKRRKDAGVSKELSAAHKRKMQEGRERKKREAEKAEAKALRETIKRQEAHLEKCRVANEKAAAKLDAAGGAARASEKVFNAWLQTDIALLNASTALKAHQARLGNQ